MRQHALGAFPNVALRIPTEEAAEAHAVGVRTTLPVNRLHDQ